MGLQVLIDQYKAIKSEPINDSSGWHLQSEKIANLSNLMHKFFISDLEKIQNFDFISSLINLSSAKIQMGHTIELNKKFKLIYNNTEKTVDITLLTPSELVEIFNENWSDTEKMIIELFFADADTWLLTNLGLYLNKQP